MAVVVAVGVGVVVVVVVGIDVIARPVRGVVMLCYGKIIKSPGTELPEFVGLGKLASTGWGQRLL